MKKRIIIVAIILIVLCFLVVGNHFLYWNYLRNRISFDTLLKLNEEEFDLNRDFEFTLITHDDEGEDMQNYIEKYVKEGNKYTHILSIENKETGNLDKLKISEEIDLDKGTGKKVLYNDDKTTSERSIDTSIVEDYKDRIKKNVVPLLVVKEENKVNEAKNSYQVSFFKSYWLVNDGMCIFLVRPQTGFAYKKENLNGSHIEEYEFNYL